MATVAEADQLILSEAKDFGTEEIYFSDSLARALAADLIADRDFPPYDRVTMDGIAIRYNDWQKGGRTFRVKATQAAGDAPVEITGAEECIEIMTGAALGKSVDTVIRYEDLSITDGVATVIVEKIQRAQNIHFRGNDKKKNEIVVAVNQLISPAIINMAAALGKTMLPVKRIPRIVVISTGDELVEVGEVPSPFQVRRSNNYAVQAVLNKHRIPVDMLHIPDNAEATRKVIGECIARHEVIILSGAVSAGKFDYVPAALEALGVKKLFHKVRQRPGGPFWFGKHENGLLVFALPGNPVSTFMCLHRYFLPWLFSSWKVEMKKDFAALEEDFTFNLPLQYFLQVQLKTDGEGRWLAKPVMGNGSGDFANLVQATAFMELPLERNNFARGEVFRIWRFG